MTKQNSMQELVADFMVAAGYPVNVEPIDLKAMEGRIVILRPDSDGSPYKIFFKEYLYNRITWLDEELDEISEAVATGDLPGLVDGLCDLLYFLLGTASSLGVEIRPIFEVIHASNMEKTDSSKAVYRGADGKLGKPVGWKHPDIAAEIQKQFTKQGTKNGTGPKNSPAK